MAQWGVARNLEKLKKLAKDVYYSDGELEEKEDEMRMDAGKASDQNARKKIVMFDSSVAGKGRREKGNALQTICWTLFWIFFFSQNNNNRAVAQE